MSVRAGQTLGQYVIIASLGKGGMASVFRASQPSLSREVAIKVLPEFFADDPAFHERFRQEAMSIARLRHPNILTVFDSGESDGVPYIVMELVDGGTLASRLGKPMPVDECVRLIGPIASALDYAHARGMVHRDIKPANILLTSDGMPILSDFGLARLVSGDSATVARLTTTGTSLGTPEYMAPEQMRQSDVGPAADIYALAVTLYEMLTGAVPYSGDTPISVITARLHDPLRLPRERNPDISEAVQAVLVKGLAKEPGDRHASAGEMLRALEAANREPATAAFTTVPTVTAAAPPSRGRTMFWAATAIVMVAGIAAALLWERQSPPANTSVANTATIANPATTVAPAAPTTVEPPASATPEPAAPPAVPPMSTASSAAGQPAIVAAPSPAPVPGPRSAGTGALPPHGKLLFSLGMLRSDLQALTRLFPGDSVSPKDDSIELTAGGDQGPQVSLPVAGIGDFVAVLRYAVVQQRPSITFRFHSMVPSNRGYAMRLPAYLQLSPPSASAQPEGVHLCCRPFDFLVAPQTPGANAIYTGPQPVGVIAPPNEEQTVVVSVTGPLMVVTAGGKEIARLSDDQFAAGAMSFSLTKGPGEPPATLRLRAFDIYETAATRTSTAAAPTTSALGRPLYSMADHLQELTRRPPQQPAENTVAIKGTSLELTAGSDQMLIVPLQAGVLDDFVTILRVAVVNLRPFLSFHFRQVPGASHIAVQIPVYRRIGAPAAGARPLGLHACCEEFDVSTVPMTAQTLYTGPALPLAPALPGDEQTVMISVKGPLIVVYADGHEIARVTDPAPKAGGMSLQVQARGKQTPAVMRLNALDIYRNP